MNSSSARPEFQRLPGKGYFESLDGLRAIAILLVLLHHTPRFTGPGPLATLQANGRYGVGFFFVIGVFHRHAAAARTAAERENLISANFTPGARCGSCRFITRRCCPCDACWCSGCNLYTRRTSSSARRLPAFAFYFINWRRTTARVRFSAPWSLAVEEQFCLVFALALVLFRPELRAVGGTPAWVVKWGVYPDRWRR